MRVKHNKKRNVYLIFEQLTTAAAQALVEGNEQKAHSILRCLKDHYQYGSEISKEFRLSRSLVITEAPSDALVNRIVTSAKQAAKNIDLKKLNQECSALIKEINYNLGGNSIYGRRVHNYKLLASIQVLFNEWRSINPNFDTTLSLEGILTEHLGEKKDYLSKFDEEPSSGDDANVLVVNIMMEKFNKEFSKILSDSQAQLIREYAFSQINDANFMVKLNDLRNKVILELNQFKSSCDNDILFGKIGNVIKEINNIDTQNVGDEDVSKFLTLIRLKEELVGENNE